MGCFIFREILYLDENGSVEGRGLAWLPLNRLSLLILSRCLNPTSPKPLGVVLQDMFDSDRRIALRRHSAKTLRGAIPSYWASDQQVTSFQRVHFRASTRRVIAYSQEDFLIKSAGDRS